ncbi:MAG: RimK family alpha-L-glutamate ligase [Anaerolineaceae bacterium]
MPDLIKSGKVAIIGSPESWHGKMLQDALLKRGKNVIFVDPIHLFASLGRNNSVNVEDTLLSECDFVLVREIPGGSLEQVIFRMDALHHLENNGTCIINSPYAIEKMVDKYYTLSLLQNAGLPVPDTCVCENFSQAVKAYEALGGDVVVKPLFGSRGVGIVRVTDGETAWRVFKALQLSSYVYYLQRFIAHNNRDLRVMVVGQQCIAAMERVASDWKTNIAVGGIPQRVDIDLEVQALCLKATSVLGADYCGLDLVRSESGELFFIEMNSMPAWQGLQQVATVNIADQIVDHCINKIRQ